MMDDSTGDQKLDGSFHERAVRSAATAGSNACKNSVNDTQYVAEYFATGQISERFTVRPLGHAASRKRSVKLDAKRAGRLQV